MEHNFGHGKKHLSTVFAYLMIIAFFVDQLQQIGCKKFKKAFTFYTMKKILWERKRGIFFHFYLDRMDNLWNSLAYGYKSTLEINTS